MMNIKNLAGKIATKVSKNLPTIATCVGIGGLITTVGLAIDISPKAKRIYDRETEKNPNMTVWEKTKVLATFYWPVAVSGTLTAGCFIFANSVNLKRNAAAIAAYQISEAALEEFKAAAAKTVGEKKTQEIEHQAAIERVRFNPVDTVGIECTGHGNQLCFDSFGNRYFRCSSEWIRRCQEKIKLRLTHDNSASINEFFYEVGLSQTDSGDLIGWNIDFFENCNFENVELVRFSYTEADNGEQVTIMSFKVEDLEPTYFFTGVK